MMKPISVLLLLVAVTIPAGAFAQSLAAVAKKEEERRKSVKGAARTYSNDDLKPDPSAPATSTSGNVSPSTPSVAEPAAPASPAPDVAPPDGEVKDEAYWRNRMGTARSALERSRIFAEALQSRINALSADIVNRDDPAQRGQLELERQRARAELDRVNSEIAEQTKAIAAIEEEARKAGVPPGWLR